MRKQEQPVSPPYVYRSGDKNPVPDRTVVMASIVANDPVNASVFERDELVWIAGWSNEMSRHPSQWVNIWMQLLRFRSAGIGVKFETVVTKKDWRGYAVRTVKGYPYRSGFLVAFQACRQVAFYCLAPQNRAALAAELSKHPYEAELLKSDRYAGSVIRGVLAEHGGPPTTSAPPPEPLVACRYCTMSYRQTEVRCPNCGGGR